MWGPKVLDFHVWWVPACSASPSWAPWPSALRCHTVGDWRQDDQLPTLHWPQNHLWRWSLVSMAQDSENIQDGAIKAKQITLSTEMATAPPGDVREDQFPSKWYPWGFMKYSGELFKQKWIVRYCLSWQNVLWRWFLSHLSFLLLLALS